MTPADLKLRAGIRRALESYPKLLAHLPSGYPTERHATHQQMKEYEKHRNDILSHGINLPMACGNAVEGTTPEAQASCRALLSRLEGFCERFADVKGFR